MNEGAVCEAVVQMLEDWASAPRGGGIRRPESEPGCPTDARIDYLVPIGSETWAIEHTVVESYEHQIKHGRRFAAYTAPIQVAFGSGLTKRHGAVHLFLDDRGLGRLPKKQLLTSQAALIGWIREALPRVSGPANHRVIERPDGVGFTVQLARLRAPWREGQLTIGRFGPPNLEEQRAKRIARALSNKARKLEYWKAGGFRTVLVLEDFDIALSNDVLVLDAVNAAWPMATACPDRIVMVDTSTNVWCTYLLVECGGVVDARHDIRVFDVEEVAQLRARPLRASNSTEN